MPPSENRPAKAATSRRSRLLRALKERVSYQLPDEPPPPELPPPPEKPPPPPDDEPPDPYTLLITMPPIVAVPFVFISCCAFAYQPECDTMSFAIGNRTT